MIADDLLLNQNLQIKICLSHSCTYFKGIHKLNFQLVLLSVEYG